MPFLKYLKATVSESGTYKQREKLTDLGLNGDRKGANYFKGSDFLH